MARFHAVLVNLGTPSAPTPEAVRGFLEEFLLDPLVVDYPRWFWGPILRRLVLRSRPERVAALYRSIWTDAGSPLEAGTRRMVDGLTRRLGPDWDVRFAYRYGSPSVASALAAAKDASAVRIVVVPLFPQRTSSTTGTIERAVHEAATAEGVSSRLTLLEIPPDDAGYVAALADRYRVALEEAGGDPEHLVISFHGIPVRYDRAEKGRYRDDCRRTAEALRETLGLDHERTTLSYQSRFGPEPWIKPPTDATLLERAGAGIRRLAVITPGFLTDGLETLEEIGEQGRASFLGAGGEVFVAVPAVEDHPALLDALAARIAG